MLKALKKGCRGCLTAVVVVVAGFALAVVVVWAMVPGKMLFHAFLPPYHHLFYEALLEKPSVDELAGVWMMDEDSLTFYKDRLGYTNFMNQADHVLALKEDGALVLKGFPRYDDQKNSIVKSSEPFEYEANFASWWKLEEKTERHEREYGIVRPDCWQYRLLWRIGDRKGDPAIYLGKDKRGIYLAMPTFWFPGDQNNSRHVHFRKVRSGEVVE